MIANYERARERILDRRRSATDVLRVELDNRLAANQRTIDSLRRAVEISHEHLKLSACEGTSTVGKVPRSEGNDSTDLREAFLLTLQIK